MATRKKKASDVRRRPVRRAVLFAGAGDRDTLNDVEYCYRMLVQHYYFAPEDVRVLYFNGALEIGDGSKPGSWPDGGGTNTYSVKVSRKASANEFRKACQWLSALNQNDVAFIYLGGHGDFDIDSGEAWIAAVNGEQYFESDFWNDLRLLRARLLVMMQQCFSGGFLGSVGNQSLQAAQLSVACSATALAQLSEDERFSVYTMNWVRAHLGKDLSGNPVPGNPDSDGNGIIEAFNAYEHAASLSVDGPVHKNMPGQSRKIALT